MIRSSDPEKAAAIKAALMHSWEGYKKYAWGFDELMPKVRARAAAPAFPWTLRLHVSGCHVCACICIRFTSCWESSVEVGCFEGHGSMMCASVC